MVAVLLISCVTLGKSVEFSGPSVFHLDIMEKVKEKSLSCVQLFATPWTVTY